MCYLLKKIFFFKCFFLVDEKKSVEATTTKSDSLKADQIVDVAKPVENSNLDNKLVIETTATSGDDTKKVNSSVSENVGNETITTSATITVNVTQTKVAIDDGKKEKDSEKIVTSVTNAAVAAISAVSDKLDVDLTKKDENNSNQSSNDVEMVELNDDVEMQDVSTVKKLDAIDVQPASTTDNSDKKAPTPIQAAVNSTVDAQQKIDENDVEKNISNLFNGDDNNVSTEDLHSKTATESISSNSSSAQVASTSDDSLKNGKNGDTAKRSPLHDPIQDKNDLVSILAGNDKTDDKISSSSLTEKSATKSADQHGGKGDAKVAKESSAKLSIGNSIDNKLLLSVKSATSTPSSSTTQTTVYNSTPIQKQFEISSENVSTISETAVDIEPCIGDKSTRQEILSSHSSTINEKSSDLSSATVTGKCIANLNRKLLK